MATVAHQIHQKKPKTASTTETLHHFTIQRTRSISVSGKNETMDKRLPAEYIPLKQLQVVVKYVSDEKILKHT